MNTPITDAFAIKFKTPCGEKYWVPVDIARKLERERDEVWEKYDLEAVENMLAVNKIRHERDEAREIARELRDAMGKLVALNTAMKSDDCTYERAYYSYYKGQYDKWESAAAALTKAKEVLP